MLKIFYVEWNYELISEKPDYDVSMFAMLIMIVSD
jgi:hypothetical protein